MDNIDKIISTRLNAVEETIKQAMELIIDAHSQCSMITYLMLAHHESGKNAVNGTSKAK